MTIGEFLELVVCTAAEFFPEAEAWFAALLDRRKIAEPAKIALATVAMPASAPIHCNALQSPIWTETPQWKIDTLGAARGKRERVLSQESILGMQRLCGRFEAV